MGRGLSLAVLVLAAAVGYALLRAAPQLQRDPEDLAISPVHIQLDRDAEEGAVARLAGALSFPTLANRDAPNHMGNPAPFQQLHDFLEKSYPMVYDKLEHERVSEYSILFTWRGSNPELRPLLAMSHLDVVPAPTEGPGNNWTHAPFSGTIADGYVWGRGALDIKVSAIQQLEAVALLLRQGYAPKRTIYLALGHDEEVGGGAGAAEIAKLLQARGVRLELVLDEGGMIMMEGIRTPTHALVEQPVALIGTAEKGFETWEITVAGTGGHSSLPPIDGSSVASRISRIVAALDASPTTTRLGPPTTDWLQALAPAVRFAPLRAAMESASNWVLNPVLGQLLGQAARELSAFVRTTCSVVSVQAGGIAENVLPTSGKITLNFRKLPGQDSAFVADYLQVVTRKEAPFVTLKRQPGGVPASPVAPASGPHYQLVKQAILETLQPAGGLRVAPYLVMGMTDSRHYSSLADGRVYRFCPHRYDRTTIQRVHGVDERIAVADLLRGITFYYRIFDLVSSDESSSEAAAGGRAAE